MDAPQRPAAVLLYVLLLPVFLAFPRTSPAQSLSIVPQGSSQHGATGGKAILAFVSARNDAHPESCQPDCQTDIYTMDTTGDHLTRLTADTSPEVSPTWSPDGTRIAFSAKRDGEWGIYVMDADGSNQVGITHDIAINPGLAWSPDGARIAYTRGKYPDYRICIMNLDGSNDVCPTDPGRGAELYPAWSPDSKRIVFAWNPDGDMNYDIYVVNSDGSGRMRLTSDPGFDMEPAWSPDGLKIAFASSRDDPQPAGCNYSHCISHIYTMNSDGSNQARMTQGNAFDINPRWSSDGKRIFFMSDRDDANPIACYPDCNYEIYSTMLDGSDVVRLTNSPGVDGGVSARPTATLMSPTILSPVPENGEVALHLFTGELSGDGPTGALIHVWRQVGNNVDPDRPYGSEIGQVQADASGKWELKDIVLEPGQNIFVASAELDDVVSQPSAPITVTYPKLSSGRNSFAHSYGFKYGDGVDTRRSAEAAVGKLRTMGFTSSYQEDQRAESAFQTLFSDSVFYFTGHGWNEGLLFDDRTSNALLGRHLHGKQLPRLRLAVLNGCEAGEDVSQLDNIMRSFHEAGTDAVIGFYHTVNPTQAAMWGEYFWTEIAQGETAHDAAHIAARWTADTWYSPVFDYIHVGINEDSIVFLGDPSLTLVGYQSGQ